MHNADQILMNRSNPVVLADNAPGNVVKSAFSQGHAH